MGAEKKQINVENYKTRLNVILTKQEGYRLPKILAKFNCANVSQLIKKILHSNIILIEKQEYVNLKSGGEIKKEEIERFEKEYKTNIVLNMLGYDSIDSLIKDLNG